MEAARWLTWYRILSNRTFTRPKIGKMPMRAAVIPRPRSSFGWRPLPPSSRLPDSAAADDTMVTKAPPIPFGNSPAYNWTGFYAGGHLGVAWGSSNWSAGPGINGSTNLFQTLDTFNEGGSFFAGVQGGYNYMLPNRILIGGEVDASFPAWPTLPTGVNPFGVSIGGSSTFHVADAWRGEFRRNRTGVRHGARPHRLRAG